VAQTKVETLMAVYVDQMADCNPNPRWRWKQACHMYADSTAELHAFAINIGLKRCWFQDHHGLPHYDLTCGMRVRAVENGAIPTDKQHLVNFMRKYRKSKKNGDL